jgi:hypothetical protein
MNSPAHRLVPNSFWRQWCKLSKILLARGYHISRPHSEKSRLGNRTDRQRMTRPPSADVMLVLMCLNKPCDEDQNIKKKVMAGHSHSESHPPLFGESCAVRREKMPSSEKAASSASIKRAETSWRCSRARCDISERTSAKFMLEVWQKAGWLARRLRAGADRVFP